MLVCSKLSLEMSEMGHERPILGVHAMSVHPPIATSAMLRRLAA